ncbi:MAG: NADH-quinone oxidoreductase subunit J, partial [Caldilinea sp.]|nr:NADH-quinone oxidoreductase subunit J [Caldilinea sp.]
MPELPFPLPPLPTVQQVVFVGIALLTVVGSLAVVLARNLFHSALGLVAAFFGAAGVYIIAEAEFIGVSQVLVYVGAISTLITFAIMLTRGMMFGATSPHNRQSGTAAIITSLTFIVLMALMNGINWPEASEPIVDGQ